MTTHVKTVTSLKEWAVTIQALAEGRQVLLLRKGGISERTDEFQIEHQEFYFYPSYEHQKPHLLKEAYQEMLQDTLKDWAGPGSPVPITHWAKVTEVVQITDPDHVDALSPHYIWREVYPQDRLHWKPMSPLNIIFVRVYNLSEPKVIPLLPEYSGCTSWIDLKVELSTKGAAPVLSDEDYAAKVAAAKAALGIR